MRQLMLVPALFAIAFAAGRAQTTETPVPFDSAGRILSVNERLATRLGLTAPSWPVTGSYADAKLYRSSDGSHVIVVQRTNGVFDRYQLTSDQAAALRNAFVEAFDRVGRVVAEDAANILSEPARAPFVRDQMWLAALAYGPALASLTDDPSVGTAAYLLSVGGTFFALTNMSKDLTMTKAQNSMATDGALRGYVGLAATLNAFGIEPSDNGSALTILTGGIGGSIVGFQRGKNLTNSEALAAMTVSTLAAGTVLGLAGMTGIVDETTKGGRWASGAVVLGGAAGYLLGPRYPRQAGYTVTAGDISIVRLGAFMGAIASAIPIAEQSHPDSKVVSALLTTGWVGGTLVADRIAAKPFNHSSGDARMVYLGALGGGLMAIAVPVLAKSENATVYLSTWSAGSFVGAIAAQRMMAPPRQGTTSQIPPANDGLFRRLELDPQGMAMALFGQKGNHTLLRLRF